MADMSWQSQSQQSTPGTAVLDMDMQEMEMMNDPDIPPMHAGGGATKQKGGLFDDMRQRMGENVTQMLWQSGSQGAKKAWSVYGNIDILRPYFDVEPKEVQMRLLFSLMPVKQADHSKIQLPRELYGPTMLVFTLIALLLYQMKTAEHRVEEGTLIGTAFGMCFTYWIGSSSFVWFVCYVCNVGIAVLQVLSMIGYALFGHCIVLFLGTVIHTSHDHLLFYFLWAIIGGLSTSRMACIIMSRTREQKERMIIIGTIAALHLLFLLYLHFAYHTIVEELSDTFNERLVPVPAVNSANLGDMGGGNPAQIQAAPSVLGDSAVVNNGTNAEINKMAAAAAQVITAAVGGGANKDSILLGALGQPGNAAQS